MIGRIEEGGVAITGPDGQRVLRPAFDPNLPAKLASLRPAPAPKPEIPAALNLQLKQALRDSQNNQAQLSQ